MSEKIKHFEMVEATDMLLNGIKSKYALFMTNKDMRSNFNETLELKDGRKFIKVVSKGGAWGFIAKDNGVHKIIPYVVGDVFKPASWNSPAKHVRGNIFSDRTDWYDWTGPNYIR